MAIRLLPAYSPGTRTKSVSYFNDLTPTKPEKTLSFGKKAIMEGIIEELSLSKEEVADTNETSVL